MINNNIQIHSKNKKSQTEIARATVIAVWGDGAGHVRRGIFRQNFFFKPWTLCFIITGSEYHHLGNYFELKMLFNEQRDFL